MANDQPEGWPAGRGPVCCQYRDVLSANPVAIARSRAASLHDRPHPGRIFGPRFCASRKSLPSDLIRGWLARRQADETIDQIGDSQPRN